MAHPKSIVYFFNGDGDMAKLVKMSAKLAEQQNQTLFFEQGNAVYVKEPITQVDIKLAHDSLNLTKALL